VKGVGCRVQGARGAGSTPPGEGVSLSPSRTHSLVRQPEGGWGVAQRRHPARRVSRQVSVSLSLTHTHSVTSQRARAESARVEWMVECLYLTLTHTHTHTLSDLAEGEGGVDGGHGL